MGCAMTYSRVLSEALNNKNKVNIRTNNGITTGFIKSLFSDGVIVETRDNQMYAIAFDAIEYINFDYNIM